MARADEDTISCGGLQAGGSPTGEPAASLTSLRRARPRGEVLCEQEVHAGARYGARTMPARLSRSIGRWASIVGHPFLVVPAAIVVATSRREAAAARVPILVVLGVSIVAIAIHVGVRLRRGNITDVDVSTREHRPQLYALAVALSVMSTAVLFATHQSATTVRGAALTTALLVAAAFVNTRLKVSLHTAFAFFAVGIAFHAGPGPALAFAVIAVVVAWARVAYSRHTVREVLAGSVLGSVFAVLQALASGK